MINKRGITLIALIITIIVLLILAGISLSAIIGDNGILRQSLSSKTKTDNASVVEALELAWSARMIKFLEESGKTIDDTYLREIANDLNDSLNNIGKVKGIKYDSTNFKYSIVFEKDSGESYYVEATKAGKMTIVQDHIEKDTSTQELANGYVITGNTSTEVDPGIFNYEIKTADNTVEIISLKTALPKNNIIVPSKVKLNVDSEYDPNGTEYNITSIRYGVFRDNLTLTGIVIPNGITSIGGGAFQRCTNLKDVDLADSITSFGNFIFEECTSLKTIRLPNNLTEISHGMFNKCTSLTTIVIPNNVKILNSMVFSNCTSLSNVTLPEGFESIGNQTFAYCTALANIELPNSLKSIDYGAFYQSGLTSVTIPGNVETFGATIFAHCDKLSSVTLSSGLTTLGTSAFAYCSSLKSISFPDGFTDINQYLCFDCTALETITIPTSVTTIQGSAFGVLEAGTSSLTTVNYKGSETQWNAITGINQLNSITKVYNYSGT